MRNKILNTLFIALFVILVIFLIAIILVNVFEKEQSQVGGLGDITGAVQSFEVFHENSNPQYVNVRTSERYDDKYFEYLEHIKERRCKTFLK